MKKFAIISNSNRVSNIITSETAPSGVTSVEIVDNNVSKGYGYTNSTFYPPVTSEWHQTPLPDGVNADLGIGLNSYSSYSASVEIYLHRELNETLSSTFLIPDSNVDISNFTHDNENYKITFDVVTSSNAASGDFSIEYSGVVTDEFGWEWDLSPIPIVID